MTQKLKRYDLDEDGAGCPYMSEQISGDYVLYSDIVPLIKLWKILKAIDKCGSEDGLVRIVNRCPSHKAIQKAIASVGVE